MIGAWFNARAVQDALFVNLVTLQTTRPGRGASLDAWQLILDASPIVKLVILALVAMSVTCWFIVGVKALRLIQASRQSRRFLDLFWDDPDSQGWVAARLEGIYGQLKSVEGSPLASVFHAGYVELARVTADDTLPDAGATRPPADVDNVARALRRATTAEMTRLENLLPFLATTGSVAPFIGLFGTVWGIMNAFLNIGSQHGASLDVVAPGIAEALIATAIGLVAAIPAVIAYNSFVRRVQVIESELDTFSSDYLNIVRRHFV